MGPTEFAAGLIVLLSPPNVRYGERRPVAQGYQETFGITNSQQIEGLLPDVKRALRCLASKVGCVSGAALRERPLSGSVITRLSGPTVRFQELASITINNGGGSGCVFLPIFN
jgi:hypothetical protein